MGKVLIYALTEVKGGVEEFVLNLSRYNFQGRDIYGYAVLGEKTVYENELKKIGVDYFYIAPKKKLIKNIVDIATLFKKLRNEYDTIYFNTSGLYYPIPYLMARKYNYKIAIHSHLTDGPFLKKYIHIFNRWWITKMAYKKMACSTPAGKWMFGDVTNVKIIPNAIEIERFTFNLYNRKAARKEFGVSTELVIGNVGRLTKFKNQRFMIEIINMLKKKNIDSKLVLIGEGEDENELKLYASEIGVSSNVLFLGRKDNPEFYLSGIDVYLMPSFIEGFPITLIEAQANGVPCVVSKNITSEVNVTGRVSFLSLDDSLDIWCEEIIRNKDRYDCRNKLIESGYDVKHLEQIVREFMMS